MAGAFDYKKEYKDLQCKGYFKQRYLIHYAQPACLQTFSLVRGGFHAAERSCLWN
jgi:hypothetical protein